VPSASGTSCSTGSTSADVRSWCSQPLSRGYSGLLASGLEGIGVRLCAQTRLPLPPGEGQGEGGRARRHGEAPLTPALSQWERGKGRVLEGFRPSPGVCGSLGGDQRGSPPRSFVVCSRSCHSAAPVGTRHGVETVSLLTR
jgi:hypothetical protein